MNQVSPILRRGTGRFFHWCPACEQVHPLPDRGWTFNGDVNTPSFSPSFKHTCVHWPKGVDARGIGRGEKTNRVCHYIITDGLIQFCHDSWHGRSDIVAMPPFPKNFGVEFAHETQD